MKLEDLEPLSDLDINLLICGTLPVNIEDDQGKYIPSGDASVMVNDIVSMYQMDFCNDASDMMPLAFDNLISIEWDAELRGARPVKWCNVYVLDKVSLLYQSNPLRAAAIVYLLLKALNK